MTPHDLLYLLRAHDLVPEYTRRGGRWVRVVAPGGLQDGWWLPVSMDVAREMGVR